MAPPLLRLHGTPALIRGGLRVPLERKDAGWLALLALQGRQPRDRLAAWLWPEATLRTAAGSLRQRIFRLRKRLDHPLVQAAATIQLLEDVTVEDEPPEAAGASGSAAMPLSTAGAELLAGFEYADCPELAAWLHQQREQRRTRRLDALAGAAARHEAAGALAPALEAALLLQTADPLSEHVARRVMRLHYLRGDRAAALSAFERFERLLKDDLGTRPGAETLALLATVEAARPAPAEASPAAALRRPGVVPASLRRPPRLVGRGAALERLEHAWQAGRIFLVLGEAGMGKTRLLSEFAAWRGAARRAKGGDEQTGAAQIAGPLLVAARPGDAGVPFALLARLLREIGEQVNPAWQELLAAPHEGTRRELARVLPELAGSGSPLAGGEVQRLALQRAVSWLLRSAAVAGADAILLDDLHFADAASLEMLQALLADEALGSLHLGLAQRGAEGAAAARALREALAETQRLHEEVLAPLDTEAMRELLSSLALPMLDAAALAPALVRHTGGNPLFALETLKDLLLRPAGPAGGLPQPVSVALLIKRRLQTLSPPALAVARVAAIAQGEFSIGLAEAVLGQSAFALADAWRELEAAQILAGSAFAHDLVRDAVSETVPAEIARHAHAVIAAHLEQRGAEPAAAAAHWQGAGRHAEAGHAWREAARRAGAQGRSDEQCDFLALAADSLAAAGRPGDAFAARAARLDPLVRSRGAEAALTEAEALARAAPDVEALGRVQVQHAQIMLWLGRIDECAQLARTALEADAAEATRLEATILLARAHAAAGTATEAVRLLDAWEAPVEALPNGLQLQYHGSRAAVLLFANRRRAAAAAAARHVELARATARQDELLVGLGTQATVLASLGQGRGAVQAAEELHALQAATDDQSATRWVHDANLGWFLLGVGRFGRALSLLEPAIERLRTLMPSSGYVGNAECFLADLFIVLGQPARSLVLLAEAPPQWPGFLRARRLLTAARARRTQRAEGAALREMLEAALALCEGDAGAPMRLAVQIERSALLPAEEAAALCAAVRVEAEAQETKLLVLLACQQRVAALRRAGRATAAADEAHALAAVLPDAAGPGLYPPAAWLVCAQAFQQAGDAAAVARALAAGRAWIEQTALPNVPTPFRESFLQRQPVNRELLTWCSRALR